MNQTPLAAAIARISSSIEAITDQQKQALQNLHRQLASSLIDEETANTTGVQFLFQNANNFSIDSSQSEATKAFQASPQQAADNNEKPTHRVFVRDVPVKSTQIKTSVPAWAAGSAPDKTLGPFVTIDGRNLWYDFYPFEELIALYVQGNPNPVLLFHISTFRRFFDKIPFVGSSETSYQLWGNTIWILSTIFTADAPANYYTGLRVNGGEIILSEAPQNINNQLTVGAGATITVQLQLDQPAITDADPTSDYGKDARAASLSLPTQFNFYFSGNFSAVIESVSDSSWNLYSSGANFVWNEEAASFDASLQEILIPLSCSEPTFFIQNNLSLFNTFSGNADIEWSAWALPVAQIDVTNPTSAAGIGALVIRCNKGISAQWAGLKNGAVNLSNPYFQLGVGVITALDLAAINLSGTQEFLLWKDAQNPHRSSIEAFYNTAFPFLFLSDVAGTEMIVAQTNTVAHIDRPVTVDAQPLSISTKNSALFLFVSQTKKTVYLYDVNILADNANVTGIAYFPQPISFALQNAVFKTTKTNELVLFGNLADDFILIEKGNLYLGFGIYAYLPILPDPYAANLGVLKDQFANYSRGAGVGDAYLNHNNQTVWLLLVCSIKWSEKENSLDDVNVSFAFA
ncbi:MAG: hypothetical protein M3R72_01730, partial [Bacteroidota bacterium]|nr:hypothetical protein [Bacteroidota bacterium]